MCFHCIACAKALQNGRLDLQGLKVRCLACREVKKLKQQLASRDTALVAAAAECQAAK